MMILHDACQGKHVGHELMGVDAIARIGLVAEDEAHEV